MRQKTTTLEYRKEYMRRWWQENKHRRQEYNRRNLVNGMEKFANGEKQRATEKRCSICKAIKSAPQFYKSNINKDGLHGWCKDCSDQRTVENGWKRIHGLTREAYDEILNTQDGRCAICKSERPTAGKKNFCVDHNHSSGAVRGILCTRCNTMIGNALDDVEILKSAIEYLEKHKR